MTKDYFKKGSFPTDPLTGVYTREVIVDYINHLVSNNIPFSMALVDIDNFKRVNDTYGHIAGDKIIASVAKKLKDVSKNFGVVARFGGDEFILVYEGIVEYDELWNLCHKEINKVNGYISPEFDGLYITITQGLSRFPLDAKNYTHLLETADKALYRGKTKGRNCFVIYLEEKHKNLVLKPQEKSFMNSMYMHSSIFRFLSVNAGLKKGIDDLFKFFNSFLMIDHICLQDEKNIIIEKIHPLSRTQNFKYVPTKLLAYTMNPASEIGSVNDIAELQEINQDTLFDILKNQKVISGCYSKVTYKEKQYGTLRAEMTTSKRIWQYSDMDLLLTASKTIALILHYEDKTLADLKK
ncbi:MAG: GGDEF domain-containing protein [Treponema sp.]|nr:GGDEF domain-containing protein [Treponema sp.]